MRVTAKEANHLFRVINKFNTSIAIDDDIKRVIFSDSWCPDSFEDKGHYPDDLPGAKMIKALLSKDGHDITHGTLLHDAVDMKDGFTVANLKGKELWDIIRNNINLNPGITTIVGFLGSMKTLLSHYLDDIYRGDYNFVSLPFLVNGNRSWFHLAKEIESEEDGESGGYLLRYLNQINLLEQGSYVGCVSGNAIKALLPWKDSKVALVNAVDPLDIIKIEEFASVFDSDMEFSDKDEIDSLRKTKSVEDVAESFADPIASIFDNDRSVASFSELLDEEISEVEGDLISEEIFAGNEKKINNVHIYCIINDIYTFQDYQRISSDNVLLTFEVFNFLNLCQVISFNNLRVEVLTEKSEYVSHPDTLKVEVLPNKIINASDNKLSLVYMTFRGLTRQFEVNLRQFIKAASFYGKVVVSSLNPSLINNGEKLILGERGLDLTFIRQLISYDNDFVRYNRRIICEIRDDQAKGAPTEGYLAAASTVINLLTSDGGYAKMDVSVGKQRIEPIIADEAVRFKYLKDSTLNVTEIDSINLTHLLKIAWLIGEVIDSKKVKDNSNNLVI